MISENQIRDRFVICLNEAQSHSTLKEIAEKSATSESYLSQLKKKNRKVPAGIIAAFSLAYGYSPTWILTGKGAMKLTILRTTEEKLINHNEQLLETIRDLLRGLIQVKAIDSAPKKETIHGVKKRK